MAISQRAVGAWAVSNATTQTVTLPTHQAGDMLIVRTIRKPFTSPDNTVINTAGWTAVATGVANGATANGNGVGSMGFKAFWKVAESAAETNPVVTWGTTAAPGACVAVSYQRGGSESFIAPVGNGGGDATARTSQTSTIATHVSVTSGDLVDFFRGQCDDSGVLTVPTITQTGVTFNTVTEYPATAIADGTSNDIAADGGYRIATAGTSSAAAVVTGTSAASEQHGAWMTRLRVVTTQDYTPALINQTAATFDPTISQTSPPQLYTPTLLDQTAVPYSPTVYGSYGSAVLADAPVAWYRMGEPSGHFADSIAGGLSSTAEGGHTYDETGALLGGQDDGAYHLSGAGTGIDIPDQSRLDLGDGPWTIELWANLDTHKDYNTLIGKHTGAYQISVRSDGLVVLVKGGIEISFFSSVALSLGVWHHIVWVRAGSSGSDNRLYIDGVEDTAKTGGGSTYSDNTADLHIGYEGPDGEFTDGSLDEVALYNTALSGARVLAHYNAAGYQTLTLGLITQTAATFTPTVTQQQLVTLGLINQTATASSPTVYGSYGSAVIADAPISWYRMGEPSGAVVDSVGGRDGTVTGTVTRDVSGLISSNDDDGAISHAGSGYWTANWPGSMGQVWTIEVWLNVTLGASTTVLSGLSNHYMFYGSAGTLSCAAGNVAVNSTASALTAGVHHVVWSRAGTLQAQNKLYVDGVDVSVASGFDSTHGTITTLRVGEYIDGSESFLGTMDELVIYNTALSQARVQAHYNAGAGAATQNVSPGLINQTAAIHAPTVTTTVSLTVALLNQAAATFAPTITTANAISVGMVSQTATTSAPTVTTTNSITVALINQIAATFDPTISVGAAPISVGIINQPAATFTPTITTGVVNVSPNLITQTATATAPTITTANSITLALINQTATTSSPTVSTTYTVSLGLINQTATATAPTITTGVVFVSLGLITQSAATFNPTITTGAVNVSLALTNQTATASAPTVTTTNAISLALLNQSAVTSTPTITAGAAPISVGIISQPAATFTPTITTGVVSVSPGLINQSATATAPTVTTSSSISVGLLTQAATTFAPSVGRGVAFTLLNQTAAAHAPVTSATYSVSLGLINQTAATSAPALTSLATISPALLDRTAVTLTPTVINRQLLTIALLDRTAVAHSPVVGIGVAVIELALLDRAAVGFPPTVTTGPVSVSLALLSQPAMAFSPSVTGGVSISLARIDQAAVLSAPTVTTGPAALTVGRIERAAAAFAPTVLRGPVTVVFGRISQPATSFAPALSTANAISVGRINQTAVLFAPGISISGFVTLARINQSATTFTPTISTPVEVEQALAYVGGGYYG